MVDVFIISLLFKSILPAIKREFRVPILVIFVCDEVEIIPVRVVAETSEALRFPTIISA